MNKEAAFISLCLFHEVSDVEISSNDFSESFYGLLWDKIQGLATRGQKISFRSIAGELEASDDRFLHLISMQREELDYNLKKEDIPSLANEIKDERLAREIDRIYEESKSSNSGKHIIQQLIPMLQEKENENNIGKVITIGELCDEIAGDIMLKRQGKNVDDSVPTGIHPIDNLLTYGGIPYEQITIFAGATNVGKSALANTVSFNAAKAGYPVLDCSFEDAAKTVVRRRIAGVIEVENRQVQRSEVPHNKDMKLYNTLEKLKGYPIYFLEDVPKSITEFCAMVRNLVRKLNIKLLTIDFFQMLKSGKFFSSKQQDVDYIMVHIQSLARSLKGTATLLVSQLKRTYNQLPTKEDLYHSATLEQYSNTIGLLWQPESLRKEFDCMSFNLDKQKNGDKDIITIGWTPQYVLYHTADPALMELYEDAISKLLNPKHGQRNKVL